MEGDVQVELSNNPAQMWRSCLGSTILGMKEEASVSKTSCARTEMANSPGSVGYADWDSVHPPFQCFAVTKFL